MPDTKRMPTAPAKPHGGGIQVFYQGKGAIRRPTVARAEGIYMWDTAGRRYIDASSGPVVSNIGHGNKRVLAAMIAQAEKVAFASRAVFENEPNARLAELVTGLAGPGLERAYFVSGGS
jgi:adenosylmethionine-8-amino-7-oxononanoate aminotransferase